MPLDPIIFLPGLLCDERIWSEQARALAPAPTLIADLTRDESVGAMAERALADAPQRFSLVAVSMGGYVAFELFRRAPERISRLALFDTRAGAETAAGASRPTAEPASGPANLSCHLRSGYTLDLAVAQREVLAAHLALGDRAH